MRIENGLEESGECRIRWIELRGFYGQNLSCGGLVIFFLKKLGFPLKIDLSFDLNGRWGYPLTSSPLQDPPLIRVAGLVFDIFIEKIPQPMVPWSFGRLPPPKDQNIKKLTKKIKRMERKMEN